MFVSTPKAIYYARAKEFTGMDAKNNIFYKNLALDTFARPLKSEEIFYDGTIKTIEYEYSNENDAVNLYQI